MANYNSGGMMGAGGGAWGGVPNAYGAGGGASWGAAPAQPKANFNPMNMGPATFNHLQSGGYDGSATANWWNNQGGANMMGGGFGGGFGAGGGGMLGGMNPMMLNNQASGDTFGNPWATGGGFDQGGGNMSMRQQMLKEANGMSKNVSSDKFAPNHPNSSSGYSLFNPGTSWNPNLGAGSQLNRNPMMGHPNNNHHQQHHQHHQHHHENPFGPLQQSSLFANQGPQSLAQLLEQQNQMQKNDFH